MDILDLRDLADEFDELKEKLEGEEFGHDDQDRYVELKKLEKELDRDLREAADEEPMLVPEHEWENYCRDLAEEFGYLSRSSYRDRNPLMDHIDWSSWADEVAQDYMTVDFDGDTYYYRSY